MTCPVCDVTLIMGDKHGVEIDYCSDCRGVWLDRGELDKILDRISNAGYQHRDDRSYGRHQQAYPYKKYRKKSTMKMLGDIFDF